MIRYDSYNDSGVEWIGEIPNSWGVKKIKHLFEHKKGVNGQKLTKDFIGKNPGIFPVYSGSTKGNGELGKTNEFEFEFEKDVIFVSTVGSDTTVMSTRILNGKFNLSQNCLVMIPKFEFNTKFFYYYSVFDFPYQRTILPIVLKEGHRSVGMGELNEFKTPFPSNEEQQQIVEFLDIKTSLIDSLIEKTQKKIELLKEERTSLINQVVTKGLNPNVEMKDSGVEWIGEIPSHWEIKPLKYLSDYNMESLGNNTDPNYELDYLEISDVSSNGNIGNPTHYKFSESPSRCRRIIRKNDIIISTVRTYLKSIGFIKNEVSNLICSTGFCVITPSNKVIPKLLFYLVRSEWFISKVISHSVGVSYPSIQSEKLVNIEVVLPPNSEQFQIIEYLDEQTNIIDTTITKEQKRIKLLKEYRQSLISEVVTGKIKVTNE